jgi:putative PEP-CTERM system TPR-repeat lipoprotein
MMLNASKIPFMFNQIMVRKSVVALLTLALVACGSVNDQQMLESAKTYLDQNKIREAALELKNALQENPDNAEARYLLGEINLDIGDNASAEKEFLRAQEAGWPEAQARIGLARVLINKSAYQKLLDEIVIKADYPVTERANLYGLRALAQLGLQQLDKARETLATGAKVDPNVFQIQKTSIQLQLIGGDVDGAASTLKQALVSFPDNPELQLLKAIIAIQNKDQVGAVAAYKNIIEHDPASIVTAYGRRARIGLAQLQIVSKNLDQAQATLAPLLKQNAGDPMVNYIGGMLAFEQGKLDLAEERLLTVLKVAPEHVQTQLLFGTVSYAQKDYEQAAYYISKYVRAVPENLGARKLLGRTYMKLGQHKAAQAALEPGLKGSGDDAELLALIGLSQLQAGDTAAGITGLEKAVNAAPDSQVLRSELAKAYISAGETGQAISEIQAMMAKGGEQDKAQALLVSAHLRAGQFDQAIDIALKMLSHNPDDPAVLAMVGAVFVASDDKTEARKYFKKVLDIKPGDVMVTMSLARIEESEGNTDKAESLYKGIAGPQATDVRPMLALARLAENKGDTRLMLDWVEKARKQAPQNINPRMILAEYYLRNRQPEKADILVKEALKIAPRQDTLLTLQARVMMAEGQYNEALSPLIDLVTHSPESVIPRLLLGEAYLKLGQVNDARRQLELALEKQPNSIPALVLLATVELKSGNQKQALKYAMQIQKTQPDLYAGYELAGDSWMARKNHPAAESAYAQAWQRGKSSELAVKFSEAATRLGKSDDATKPLLEWLKTNPDDVRVLQSLGTTYQNAGKDKQAVAAYENVLAVQPESVIALNNLAWLYTKDNDPRAIKLAEQAYRINPNDSGIQDTYGWVLVRQGQVDKGRRLLKQALDDLPNVPEVRYHYAVALMKSGKKVDARIMLTKLLEQNRDFEGHTDAERLLNNE